MNGHTISKEVTLGFLRIFCGVTQIAGGDVPADIGVCTDVVIRAYRAIGTDLQRLVHEDMAAHFDHYPSRRIWGLSRPDRNIDHRRVPNLRAFLERHGEVLVTVDPDDYEPGDIVTWVLPGNLSHIGIVSDRIAPDSGRPLVVHNIGASPRLEDVPFDHPVTGRYRHLPVGYRPPRAESASP
jgi:uncharacterized protein YijF (DUF1287 family)